MERQVLQMSWACRHLFSVDSIPLASCFWIMFNANGLDSKPLSGAGQTDSSEYDQLRCTHVDEDLGLQT